MQTFSRPMQFRCCHPRMKAHWVKAHMNTELGQHLWSLATAASLRSSGRGQNTGSVGLQDTLAVQGLRYIPSRLAFQACIMVLVRQAHWACMGSGLPRQCSSRALTESGARAEGAWCSA
eukprot:1159727-Pelagomonas_calceolata.AAC.7